MRGGKDEEDERSRQRHAIEANLWCLRWVTGAELGIREGVALIFVGAVEWTRSMSSTARHVIFLLTMGWVEHEVNSHRHHTCKSCVGRIETMR